MKHALESLRSLARRQHGVFHRSQALAAGLGRMTLLRGAHSGRWRRVHPGVYALPGAVPTVEQRLMAALLWLGDEAVVSHRSAARLWGLWGAELDAVEVTAKMEWSMRCQGVMVHRSGDLGEEDRRVVDGFKVTSLARTLVDVSSCIPEEALALMLESGWRRKSGLLDWLERRLSQLGHRRGVGVLKKLVSQCRWRRRPMDSPLEVRLWRSLVAAELPWPRVGTPFEDDEDHPGRLDLSYPEHRLALEAHGWEFHRTRESFERDCRRQSRLAALGWRIIHVTSRELDTRKEDVIDRVRRAMGEATSV